MPAAGQVAIADEADRDPVPERVEQLAARLPQADDPDAGHAARPLELRLEAGVVDRLHRASTVAPTRSARNSAGELHRAEVETDEEDRPAGHERASAIDSGVSRSEAVVDEGRP